MMKAFYVSATNSKVKTIPIPIPEKNEVLIKILRAGVCNTDLEILKGYMGFEGVVGHEFVGVVTDVNKTSDNYEIEKARLLNKRVCGDINCACFDLNNCNTCKIGGDLGRNHCPTRTVLGILGKNGTYSEYITLPIRNLHLIPDTIDDETAVFVEPLAAACRIIEQKVINVNTDCVAVIGDGKLGLLIMEVLARQNFIKHRPMILGHHPEKMCLLDDLNVQMVMLKDDNGGGDDDKIQTISEEFQHKIMFEYKNNLQNKFDVVIDATGSPGGLNLAAFMTRPLGKLVLKSTCAVGSNFNTAPFVIDEINIVGSRCGPFPQAILLLNNHPQPFNMKKYISNVYKLSEAKQAIEKAKEKGSLKVQILVD